VTESLLNLAWLTVAFAASAGVLAHRHDRRALAALLCGLALLFPIISVSDDSSGGKTLEEIVAVLTAIAAIGVLTALFHVPVAPPVLVPIRRTIPSDPRSPPRG